ncbi:MAG: patatin-like phospholipase RssA [Psychrobium sp.]|nr:patatin-like phospholipase RssA [Psychrobium sp.]
MVKIGIALGSGSAKGWAHIGVLQGLAELGIKPEVVAGSSIGAFVGAAYACDKLTPLTDWVNGFSQWDLMTMMDISLRKGGLLSGDKVFEQARTMIGDCKIEELKYPFIAVATDLYSGKEVWLRRGDLQDAVRASCSIPGLMAPKRIGDNYYIDGAVVNPIPVNVCRHLGADLVIAVDLNGYPENNLDSNDTSERASDDGSLPNKADASTDKPLNLKGLITQSKQYFTDLSERLMPSSTMQLNMFAVMSSALEILENRQKKSRLAGEPPDILILPKVSHIGSMDFNRAPEAIQAGYDAVMKIRHVIEAEFK